MSAYFLDTLQGLTTLKVFGLSVSESETVASVGERFRKRTLKVLRYAFVSGLVLEFTVSIAIAIVAVELGIRLLRGDIAFQPAFLVLLLAPEFYRPLRDLGVSRHAGMEGKAAAERIFEVLNTSAPPDAAKTDATVPEGTLDIELDGLSFAYPEAPRPALSNISLTLPAGTTTALVGRSGAGKSTLVNLLLRFMEPDGGGIKANGVDVSGLSVEGWRERVALVPQRPYLFYGSVLENIRLAKPDAKREEVERAAKLAGANDFIRRLPEGYETGIGERGARLSGGEAQRIAIARAFLKDAPLLVLDEPTSSLDPESEKVVRRAVERLAEGAHHAGDRPPTQHHLRGRPYSRTRRRTDRGHRYPTRSLWGAANCTPPWSALRRGSGDEGALASGTVSRCASRRSCGRRGARGLDGGEQRRAPVAGGLPDSGCGAQAGPGRSERPDLPGPPVRYLARFRPLRRADGIPQRYLPAPHGPSHLVLRAPRTSRPGASFGASQRRLARPDRARRGRAAEHLPTDLLAHPGGRRYRPRNLRAVLHLRPVASPSSPSVSCSRPESACRFW